MLGSSVNLGMAVIVAGYAEGSDVALRDRTLGHTAAGDADLYYGGGWHFKETGSRWSRLRFSAD